MSLCATHRACTTLMPNHRRAKQDLSRTGEKAAAHGAGRHIRIDDRATWDRAAWNRYITAVTQLEPDFMPEMLRLTREIERLERLVALPAAPSATAG